MWRRLISQTIRTLIALLRNQTRQAPCSLRREEQRPVMRAPLDSSMRRLVASLTLEIKSGGASVLVNGPVFKTVCEPVRAGSGRFDSYTPPPKAEDEG